MKKSNETQSCSAPNLTLISNSFSTSKCKIIAIANQKGGTAKTTTACNLGYAIARSVAAESGCQNENNGKNVLLVDMDSQGNLSMVSGIESPDHLEISISDLLLTVMEGEDLPAKEEYIYPAKRMGADATTSSSKNHKGRVDILPSNIKLANTAIALQNAMNREFVLKTLLDPLREHYDYIIIDCSPTLGLTTLNALTACDEVIIPVSPEHWAVVGMTDLVKTIQKIKRLKINPELTIAGVLMTKVNRQTNLYKDIRANVEESFGRHLTVFSTEIPEGTAVGVANFTSTSIVEGNPKAKAAIAYVELANELIQNKRSDANDDLSTNDGSGLCESKHETHANEPLKGDVA